MHETAYFPNKKLKKISKKGHSSLSKRHPTGKETPSHATLSPHKKKEKSAPMII